MIIDTPILIVIFLFGLEFGSFGNVCIYRWPLGKSVRIPRRSFCPWCKNQIRWFDNIPVISYFALKGRCRSCHSKISIKYPLIELTVALMWLITAILLSAFIRPLNSIFLLSILYFILMLVILTVTDLEWKVIPDECSYGILMVGLLSSYWNPLLIDNPFAHPTLNALLGGFVGGGVLLVISWGGQWIFKKESMGGGDIKLLAGFGVYLGVEGALWSLILASFIGGGIGIIGLLSGVIKRHQYIPFGPFLVFGALISLFSSLLYPEVSLNPLD